MKNQIKKILLSSLFVIVLSCVMSTFFTVSAEVYGGECGVGVTWSYNDQEKILTISGSGAIEDFDSFDAAPWHIYKEELTKIIIQDGITRIGNYSFSNSGRYCETISIPSSVTTIGKRAFANCTGLETIEIPDSVIELGAEVMDDCDYLETVKLSKNILLLIVNQ